MAKTIKRSKERKQDLVREVRESVDTYSNLFVFSINNMRNNRLKDLRAHWNTSRYVKNESMWLFHCITAMLIHHRPAVSLTRTHTRCLA